jgi:hypothetical protein
MGNKIKKFLALDDNFTIDELGRVEISDQKLLEKINGAFDASNLLPGWIDTSCNSGCDAGCNVTCPRDNHPCVNSVCGC